MTQDKKILIADDEPEGIQVLLWYFKEAGLEYEFLQAPNGEIACKLAEKYDPDLIIMDWDMPVMSGLQAVKRLRNQEATKGIPIIIATGTMLHDKHLEEALKQGAVDYLRKPVSQTELLARATSALALAEAHQRERELLQAVVDQKARQLSSMALHLAQKNQLLADLLQQVEGWKGKPEPKQVRTVARMLQNNLSFDDDWERFQMHFEEVHPGFFSAIQKRFPDLTNSDIRLCAYLRMRLENKEIAQLLNISPKGIETARYRLRKRLELTREVKLNEFIQGL